MAPAARSRRICVLGSRGVGKSAVSVQFAEQHFEADYNPTIEATRTRTTRYRGTDYHTELVDTAGQDTFSHFPPSYVTAMDGYVLVYSVASRASLEMLCVGPRWGMG